MQPRMLCADLVDVQWRDQAGRRRREAANLEDISTTGACIQMEQGIPAETQVRIVYPDGKFDGVVKYCTYKDIGYFIGIEFGADSRWHREIFLPQHLLDPRTLLAKTEKNIAAGA